MPDLDDDWKQDFRLLVAEFVRSSPTTSSWDCPSIVREAANWADVMQDERRRRRGIPPPSPMLPPTEMPTRRKVPLPR